MFGNLRFSSTSDLKLLSACKLSETCLADLKLQLALLIPTRSQHGVQVALLKPSRPHQDLQRTTLQALRRTHGCRKWLKLDLRRTHDGPKMAPRWPRIAPNVPKMDPRWPHEAPRHTIIKICVLAHKNWGVRSRPCFSKKQPCSALPIFCWTKPMFHQ